MTSIFDEYVSGGYFLIKVRKLAEYVNAAKGAGTAHMYFSEELLPERILTIADCLTDKLPSDWAIEWAGVEPEIASIFGISLEQFPEIMKWVTAHVESDLFRFPNIWLSPEDASQFIDKFEISTVDLALVGIGLHHDLTDSFLAQYKASERPGDAIPTLYEVIRQRKELKLSGEILGWELLSYEYHCFHSWLCHGAERAVYRELGIRPNAKGFINTLDEANRAAEYLNRDGFPLPLSHPWLIVQYPLS